MHLYSVPMHCADAPGQYNDAAYSLVQLRKILEDSSSNQDVLPGSELAALQAACASCERSLEEVSCSGERWKKAGVD